MTGSTFNFYDVVVLGGGPAGSSAAFTAASSGIRVCVIDKRSFPREKLCGGLVTLRSKGIFERVFHQRWDDNLLLRSDVIEFFSANRPLARVDGYSSVYFTMRFDFDNYLLQLAKQAGAELRLGVRVSDLDLASSRIRLDKGGEISYGVLIGADGVNSTVAKMLFGSSFNERTIGFGLEVEVPRDHLPEQANSVEIDFAAARWGYGWVFPKKKTFTVGVGGIHRRNPDMKRLLAEYVSHKQIRVSDYKVKGQYIPFGDFRKAPGKASVLLCGDAAGVVDPITGEGIAYAMQTGQAAAEAAIAATREHAPNRAYERYLPGFEPVARGIREANLWKHLIFPEIIQRPFAWAFRDASTLQRGYLDILAGEREYSSLYQLFGRQVLKALTKPLRMASARIVGSADRH